MALPVDLGRPWSEKKAQGDAAQQQPTQITSGSRIVHLQTVYRAKYEVGKDKG